MIWKEVEIRFGKEIANAMKKSHYLEGITVTYDENCEIDYPESDIELAFKDVMGYSIHYSEWD